VDGALRSSVRGVFCAGNLLHAAETADVAALGGRHAARSVARFLERGEWPATAAAPILCEPPLAWIAPGAVRPGSPPPRGRFTARTAEFRDRVEVTVRQGDRLLWQHRFRRLVPSLPIAIGSGWIEAIDVEGPPLIVRAERA
jgi:hypothetical protein